MNAWKSQLARRTTACLQSRTVPLWLLLVACCLASPLQADNVYLHSVADVYQVQSHTQYPANSWRDTEDSFVYYRNDYTNGGGFLGQSREFYRAGFNYVGTSPWPDAPDWSSFARTNITTNPWQDSYLGNGTNTETMVWIGSTWQLTEGGWVTLTNTYPYGPADTTNCPPPEIYSWLSYYNGADYASTTTVTNGDGGTVTTTTTIKTVHTVHLATSAPSNSTGSALFKLTSGFGIPGATNENVLADFAGAYTLAGETPDNEGVVWKTYADGSTNDVSVRIRSTHTGAVTNFTFNPTANRATLGIQWKSADTNDTNWQSGPLYVLKNTTVLFRVQATVGGNVDTNVNWPAGTPAWSASTNNTAQISVTFDTVSTTTNGHWVTVTAGSMASNQVVVYDFKIVPTARVIEPAPRVRFVFGVGEDVDFSMAYIPEALSNHYPYTFVWSANGTADTNGLAPEDISRFSGHTLSAGCLHETNTITAILAGGINTGATRVTNVVIVAPTNVNLLAIRYDGGFYYTNNSNVGHTQFIASCVKAAHYQVLPLNVSFTKIRIAEGPATYSWIDGTNDIPHEIYQGGAWTSIGNTNLPPTAPDHPQHPHREVSFALTPTGYHLNTVIISSDRFGYPNWSVRSPSVAKTNTINIPITYILSAKTNAFTTVESVKIVGPQGRVVIKKDGLGPYAKEFTDPDSPE